ncbi:MAG: hypothetical protein UD936_04660, partial [Acutalibacteraceae bacterium]|nr:hypothetical protein [Acutalibacteraceae bacterium]
MQSKKHKQQTENNKSYSCYNINNKKNLKAIILCLLLTGVIAGSGCTAMKPADDENSSVADKTESTSADKDSSDKKEESKDDTAETPTEPEEEKKVSRINYYDSDGELLYYDSYAYYDNGLLCSTTLHSIKHYREDDIYISPKYTFLYLYDKDGNLTDTVLDTLSIAEYYNITTGEITLDYDAETNEKINIFPEKESIEQEKYGVDPSKTEKIYGDAPVITTDCSNGWVDTYLNQVFNKDSPTDTTECRFIYVDDNSVPELWIDYCIGVAGAVVYTQADGVTDSFYLNHGSAQWIEKGNLILNSGGHQDMYYNTVYNIENGKFVEIGKGNFGRLNNGQLQLDENNAPIYDYRWNDTELTKEKYYEEINKLIDTEKTVDINQNIYTYKQCKLLLKSLSSTPMLDDLVQDAKNSSVISDNGPSYSYVIPKILLDSNDAQTVNDEILSKHQKYYDELDNYSTAPNLTLNEISYKASFTNGILSVCINRKMGMGSEYDVYNFDVATGKLLTNEDFCDKIGLSYDDIKEQIISGINDYYENLDSNPNASYQQWKAENLNYSLSEENLSFAKVYYEDGVLTAMYRV